MDKKQKVSGKTKISVSKPKSYGNFHFEIPTIERKLKAIDLTSLDKNNLHYLTSGIDEFFQDIDIPQKSDWLWEHKETGQTYKTYITGIINQPSKSHYKVYIKNLDKGLEDSFLNDDMLQHLKTLLDLYYPGIKAEFLDDENNFETLKISKRMNGYLQYHAGETIDVLSKYIPKDGLIIIGLTSYDLYPRDEWNFVFGLANQLNGCGVFSFRRYYDELSGSYTSQNKFIDTVTKFAGKVMLHETGHLFGMKHCIYFKCIMNGSNHMEENFRKPFQLCPVCLRKIMSDLKFNIIDRYNMLADGLEKINNELYKDEITWYKNRVQYLQSNSNSKSNSSK